MRKDYYVPEGTFRGVTAQQKQAFDERDGRRRYTGKELEALIELNAGKALIASAMPDLERVRKDCGDRIGRMLPALLESTAYRYAQRMSSAQLISMDNQLNHGKAMVSVTTTIAPPQYVNIRHRDLLAIIRGCCDEHCAYNCTRTLEQSKSCRIRQALDNIPGLPGGHDGAHCPYSMIDMSEGSISDGDI